MQYLAIAQATVLVALAKGLPVIAKKIFGSRFARPLDGGVKFLDRQPLFGASKTIRGILVSLIVATAGAPFVGLEPKLGALAAAAAMAGDLFSRFVKRRPPLKPSSRAPRPGPGPESLLPPPAL